jgi:hypothetical protein
VSRSIQALWQTTFGHRNPSRKGATRDGRDSVYPTTLPLRTICTSCSTSDALAVHAAPQPSVTVRWPFLSAINPPYLHAPGTRQFFQWGRGRFHRTSIPQARWIFHAIFGATGQATHPNSRSLGPTTSTHVGTGAIPCPSRVSRYVPAIFHFKGS